MKSSSTFRTFAIACLLVGAGLTRGSVAGELNAPIAAEPAHWVKGNLCPHSQWSEGGGYPERIGRPLL